ncbi:MAG: ribonucleoside-diphosphate reductase subunit alpha [Proteobacteria bacterium]|nr:ribonucleoside-diphosphate reductase subunit alpha [Pseudomonadota bacterium]NBP15399.1 ribonucleoside-diphosphate reductase subunit alpha [bacterium]
MSSKISVKKRDGSLEKFNIEKIHKIINWAIDGITGVALSDIEINAKLNMVDGISSKEIHNVLIESTANLISLDAPNYQYVAGRLLNYQLRKDVWGGKHAPRLLDVIFLGLRKGIYDESILEKYSEDEINKAGEYIDHDRDFIFTYAGIKQLCDKYLIKNRITNVIYETPQFAYMLISLYAFANYPKESRLEFVRRFYNAISKHKINLPTPVMAGVRTNSKSYASCCLIGVDDNKESITASGTAVSIATASRCGIGIDVSKIRAIGAPVNNGEVVHTGVIPFLKIFEASVKAWQQNGLRGGSATTNIMWWHYEIEDVVVLKNNAGTDDNRVRKLDYTVGMSKLFYDRVLKDEQVTLFSPHEVPELWDAWGTPKFDKIYKELEDSRKVKMKKKVSARKLFGLIVKERVETGRIYILNVDSANEHGSWADKITMSNLCTEVIHPTIPLKDFNDPDAEIGMCILSAINMLEIKDWRDLEKTCDLAVRFLDEIIDIQSYFNKAAENFAKKRRSIGIGITNFAAFLAKNNKKYSDKTALTLVDEWMEHFQYYLLTASLNLAKEKGRCEKFDKTKYSKGILPIDTYKRKVDEVVKRKLTLDWNSLRDQIKQYGLRHSTLSCVMPCESSSVIQCSTNGIEPVRSLVTFKTSKMGKLPVLVPGIGKYESHYQTAFSLEDNMDLINLNAVIQKYIDMAISTNIYYNYSHYNNNILPDAKVMKEIMYAYSMGLISLYYNNTDDGDKEQSTEKEIDCSSGACKL